MVPFAFAKLKSAKGNKHSNGGRPQESLFPEVACVRPFALVPATTLMVVMAVPTKPQDQVGPAIVGPVVVAMPIVAPATMDGSAATKMAVPPATMRTPPAASMITMCFGDKSVLDDGIFTQPAKRRGLCHDGGT